MSSIQYQSDDNNVEEFLTTYSEEDRQQAEINKNNAGLIWKQKNFTIPTWMFTEFDLSGNEVLIFAFIWNFLDFKDRFYFDNETLAVKFNLHENTVKNTLKKLKEKGLIKLSYRVKAGGGQIRFVRLTKIVSLANKNCQTLTKIVEDKRKEKVNKKKKENKFIKPTIEDICAYCDELQCNVDPHRFFDYYEANGWRVGRNLMKDWRATVRYWRSSNYANTPKEIKYPLLT